MVNIAIDLDGVCCDFSKKLSQTARKLFGKKCQIVSDEDVPSWNWSTWYPLTEDEVELVYKTMYSEPDFWINLEPLDDDNFKLMYSIFSKLPKTNVYFVTARGREKCAGAPILDQCEQWLENHGWKSPQVILAYDKGPVLSSLNITHFIDDKPDNILSALQYSKSMCYSRYAKSNDSLHKILKNNSRYKRVYNLKEFTIEVLKDIKKGPKN